MQKLEKILEEMKESSIMVATSKEHYIHPQDGRFVEEVVLLNDVEEIIRKHMSGKGKDAHMNDGWVPVEDRLPIPNIEVWVTVKRNEKVFTSTDIMTERGYFLNYEKGNILAWKEKETIPEPYQAKRTDWREKMLKQFDRRETL